MPVPAVVEHGPATFVALPRLAALVALGPIAAAVLLASIGGCSAAVAPEANLPDPPEEHGAPDTRPPPPVNDRLRLSVTADVRSVAEGDEAVFKVVASGAPSRDPVLVEYAVSGTALPDADYTRPSSTTTLEAGAAEAWIAVKTLADNESEPRETISVVLERATSPTGEVAVDTTPATVTVAERNTPIVSVAPAVAGEGEPAAFTISVSGGAQTGITVRWETADGTAVAGTDYTPVTGGTVVFVPGASLRQTIRVATRQDQLDEDDETFEVSLTGASPSSAVALGRATVLGTITDDDDLPQLTIENSAAAEDAGSMSFRVRLAPASGRLVTVSYRTEDDTATAGSDADYSETGGTLRFVPGAPLEQVVQVAVADDDEDESEEALTLRLYAPANATLRDAEATGIIIDNDDSGGVVIEGLPSLDITDSRAGEGDGIMVFTVTMNRPAATTATVSYKTQDGTATTSPGSDYTKTEGELTFSPGTTLQETISVPILQDEEDEGTSERFSVKLLDPVNAVLGDDTAYGVIVDDDAPADDHGDTRADATSITQGSPISGRLETADDVDYFKFTVTADGDAFAVTDAGRIGDDGYPAGTVVRFESVAYTSSNNDNFDSVTISQVTGTPQVHVRVSGTSATRYDVAVWFFPPAESDTSFDIDLRYIGTEPTQAQRNAIRAAADTWESVITGGLPSGFIANSNWTCDDADPSAFGDYIDDLRIDVKLKRIDGASGILALAGPCVRRVGALPIIGEVVFDTADLGGFDSTVFRGVVVHEIAHVLGFGAISQWSDSLRDSAVDYKKANPESTTLPDTHFAGAQAVGAFDELLAGATYDGNKVPVENNTESYGPGALDGHWRESVFGTELMTPSLSGDDTDTPLSKVTIAALADLGYSVDYTQAVSYTLPSTSLTTSSLLGSARAAFDEIHVGDDIRRGPVIVAEYPE